VALRLRSTPWRWKGVPFYIRRARAFPYSDGSDRQLRQPPAVSRRFPSANYFRFRVTPDLMMGSRRSGEESGEQSKGNRSNS